MSSAEIQSNSGANNSKTVLGYPEKTHPEKTSPWHVPCRTEYIPALCGTAFQLVLNKHRHRLYEQFKRLLKTFV